MFVWIGTVVFGSLTDFQLGLRPFDNFLNPNLLFFKKIKNKKQIKICTLILVSLLSDSVPFALLPLSLIPIAILLTEPSPSFPLALAPLALVVIAVGAPLHALTLLLSAHELAFVDISAERAERAGSVGQVKVEVAGVYATGFVLQKARAAFLGMVNNGVVVVGYQGVYFN